MYRAWHGSTAAAVTTGPRLDAAKALRQGLISNLANPKMAAFFLSLLPQFSLTGGITGLLLFGLLFSLLTFAWLTVYSLAVDRARRLFARSRVRRAIDAVTGTVLLASGARLALEQR